MQLCYIKVFSADYRSFKFVYVLPFVVFAVAFLTILYPVLSQNIKTTALWWPVVVYAISISAMGIFAVLRKQDGSYQMIVWGAILFIISDATIALSKFVMPFELSSVVIMVTYAASQYLIVSGVIRATK
jgi:uncharacterized membrane protein YhhN